MMKQPLPQQGLMSLGLCSVPFLSPLKSVSGTDRESVQFVDLFAIFGWRP